MLDERARRAVADGHHVIRGDSGHPEQVALVARIRAGDDTPRGAVPMLGDAGAIVADTRPIVADGPDLAGGDRGNAVGLIGVLRAGVRASDDAPMRATRGEVGGNAGSDASGRRFASV